MKLADILKKAKEKNIEVEEAAPVIIPLKAGQTYKDLIYEELGGRVRAAETEIEKFNKETDRILELFEKQGEYSRNVIDKDRFGHERLTSNISKRCEELLAPRRRKLKSLEEKLKGEEAKLSSKAYSLLYKADILDNLHIARYREEIFDITKRKVDELLPYMKRIKDAQFYIDASTGGGNGLIETFNDFAHRFYEQAPTKVNEDALKTEFFKEFEKVKAEVEKEDVLKELEDYEKEEKK